jgi:hypothetical protein
MSDYVEARYAVIVLRQAHLSSDAAACDMVTKLIKDLCPHIIPSPGPAGSKRVEALEAIRSLAVSFDHHVWPPASYWDIAHQAALDWCGEEETDETRETRARSTHERTASAVPDVTR